MIFRRLIGVVGLLLLVVACKRLKGPDKPKNLLSKEEMVNIIIDAKLISSASSITKRIMQDSGVVISDYVYKRHNIDSVQFAESNSYYAFHVKDYDAIYTKVSDSLESLKQMLKEREAEEWKIQTKREEDSLKAIKADSIKAVRETLVVDSLETKKMRDSLAEKLLQKNANEGKGLIEPILDTVSLQH
ncbi:DUF4296 domain-containing protein [Tamlana crocina]|uniref:DUF4296 domain-containing protein n=1 Tax=Tamlana crocina TaxID=393006 RepID=A0ABX1DF17_9FLAO|nr:DUF4296 domain-containing protein [Tamlana crocina]NJX14896.1 DUF4296 domain-containing protein [Tamlana crocina]